MSYVKKIGTGAILVYAQNILSALFGMFGAIITIRLLGVRDYGVLTLAVSTMGLVLPFMDFGMGQVVTSDIAAEIGANRLDRVKRLLIGYSKFGIFAAAVLSVGLYLSAETLFGSYGDEFRGLIKISSVVLFLYSFRNILLVFFGGFSNFKALSVFQTLESLARLVFVVVLVWVYRMGATGAMLAILFSMLVTIIIVGLPLALRLAGNFRGIAAASGSLYKNTLLSYGKFQILSQPLKTIFEGVRSWIITVFAGIEALAIFQVAIQIYSYINMFIGAIEAVMMPIFAEEFARSIEVAKRLLVKMTKYVTWLGWVVVFASWIFVPGFLEMLFGIKYLPSVPLILYALISLPIDAMGLVFRPALFALRAQKSLLKITFYLLSTAGVLGAILTYFYGAWGFILIMPFSSVLSLYLRYKYLVKEEPELAFSYRMIFSWDLYDRELFSKIIKRITGKS